MANSGNKLWLGFLPWENATPIGREILSDPPCRGTLSEVRPMPVAVFLRLAALPVSWYFKI